jgi:uncharacterized membrane-anchored protein
MPLACGWCFALVKSIIRRMALTIGLFIIGFLFLFQAIVAFFRREPGKAWMPLLAGVMALGFLVYLLHDWDGVRQKLIDDEKKAATQPAKPAVTNPSADSI